MKFFWLWMNKNYHFDNDVWNHYQEFDREICLIGYMLEYINTKFENDFKNECNINFSILTYDELEKIICKHDI